MTLTFGPLVGGQGNAGDRRALSASTLRATAPRSSIPGQRRHAMLLEAPAREPQPGAGHASPDLGPDLQQEVKRGRFGGQAQFASSTATGSAATGSGSSGTG